MDNKLSELKAAAMAATPGPWSYNGNCKYGIWWPAENCYVLFANTHEDSAFIAAANPAVVLALLAELEIERASREQWQRNFQRTEERAERLDSMLTESVQALKAVEQRNAELEAKLATPVRLQSPWVDKVGNRWLLEGTTADVIRAAGLAVTVEGDEQ
ncbi:TPA: ead/Ea22-like family protein [Serratia marcescens]